MRREIYQLLRRLFTVAVLALVCNASLAAKETLDVMVLYTPEATQVSKGDPEALIVSFVNYANKAYQLSGMDIGLRLVHMQQYSPANSSSVSSRALHALTADSTIKRLRDEKGADLVSLVTRRSNSGGGFLCGISWIASGRNGQLTRGAKDYAFSVSAADCGLTTFVHELGHTMGLDHSLERQNGVGGVFKYGRGYGVNNSFATVMAYEHLWNVRDTLQQFSNPEKLCKNLQCGVNRNRPDGADSVYAVNQIARQLAAFAPTKVDDTDGGGNSGSNNGGGNNGGGNNGSGNNGGGNNGGGSNGGGSNGGGNNAAENLIVNGDMESGKRGWYKYRRSSLKPVRDANSGKYSLLVKSRRAQPGVMQSLLGDLEKGHTYSLSAWLKFQGKSTVSNRQPVNVRLFYSDNRGKHWQTIALRNLVIKSGWHQFSGQFTFSATGRVRRLLLLIDSPNSRKFQLDDVEMRRQN